MCDYGNAYMQGVTDGKNRRHSTTPLDLPEGPYKLGLLAGSRAATTNPIHYCLSHGMSIVDLMEHYVCIA